ncbi:hypothetical protein [Methanobrevibacter sp.]|uniref:hypothetical protein n=1 Tax=Methanobrevibacter sp. TaxID=66852 RepID=UPI003890C173
MSKRNIVANWDIIDEDFINDFINVPDGLPILLMNILDEFDEDIELKRFNIYKIRPEFEELDKYEIAITSNLLKEGKSSEAEEFQIDYALEFLEKYPQFSSMVNGVESAEHNDIKIALSSIKEAFLGDLDYF